jgi:hypothetical protein
VFEWASNFWNKSYNFHLANRSMSKNLFWVKMELKIGTSSSILKIASNILVSKQDFPDQMLFNPYHCISLA